jgi:hypothetical protein
LSIVWGMFNIHDVSWIFTPVFRRLLIIVSKGGFCSYYGRGWLFGLYDNQCTYWSIYNFNIEIAPGLNRNSVTNLKTENYKIFVSITTTSYLKTGIEPSLQIIHILNLPQVITSAQRNCSVYSSTIATNLYRIKKILLTKNANRFRIHANENTLELYST